MVPGKVSLRRNRPVLFGVPFGCAAGGDGKGELSGAEEGSGAMEKRKDIKSEHSSECLSFMEEMEKNAASRRKQKNSAEPGKIGFGARLS